MNTLSLTTTLLTHSLAWALLYSLWQGLLVFGALYVILKALPNINARAKYYISYSSFTALFLWFANTWITEYQKLKGVTVYITQPGLNSSAGTTYAVKTVSTAHLQSPVLHHYLPRIEHYFPLIMLIYSIGLSFMLFRFLVNVLQIKALRTQGIIQPEQQWNDFITEWQKQFDISRPVKLLFSGRIQVPMMLGAIKPVILLPIATMNHLSIEQVEAILLHELAHIKRHDYVLNIFQTIVETLLFFNPFVWLVSSIIRREREHCCDDMVISCNASPLSYARALAILEDDRIHTNGLALAATGHKNQLLHRIKRIMEMKKSNINYTQLTIIVVAIIALTLSVAMLTFTPSFAQKAKSGKKSDTTAKTKSVYKYKSVTIDKNGKRTETVKESSKPMRKGDHASDRNDNDNNGSNDDDDVNVNVVVNGNKSGSHSGSNSSSYSYSYSWNNGDDIRKMVKDVIAITKNAMDNVDLKELEKEMENAEKAMNGIDWREIRDEVEKGIEEVNKELNSPKFRKEVNVQIRKELEHTKQALERTKKELERNRRVYVSAHTGKNGTVTVVSNDDEDDMAAPPAPPAPPSSPNMSAPPVPPIPPIPPIAPSNNIEAMLSRMEKDGLIDRSKQYKVEKEDDALYINGEKQSADTYNKYNSFLKDNKTVSIKGRKGSLSISITD